MISNSILKRYTYLNLKGRQDEKIDISDNVLRYTFRPLDGCDKYSRVAYNLVLKDIKSFKYYPADYKLIFRGKMSTARTNDSAAVRSLQWASPEDNELVIYDYFEPSLYEELQNKGVLTDDLMEVEPNE
jgi:hypothetical protein